MSKAEVQRMIDDTPRPLVGGVRSLAVHLPKAPDETVQAVRSVSFEVTAGQRVGIVGESGSGKSVTGRTVAGLLPESPRVRVEGSVRLRGEELLTATPARWREVRRREVSMIFQDR